MDKIFESLLKKVKTQNSKRPIAKKPDEDFIPYVCHYDPSTILTKNGELLQVIRIDGFGKNSAIAELISLRDAVRDAVIDHIKDNKFALWFNIIRRKKSVVPSGNFTDFLSQKLDKIWTEENRWNEQYINELYITIITEGLDSSIINFQSFLRSLSYSGTKSAHETFLKSSHKKLSEVSEKIFKDLREYGAKMLGIKEWEGVLYSEPMRFFGKIVNLYEERYPLSVNDMSNDLASHKIAFGDRDLEVFGYDNKNFATVLSLKEYFEISSELLERILNLPFEFVITQSFDFSYSKKDLNKYEYQNYVLQVSGDEDLRQISGIANFLESKSDSKTDYGKLQTTIMLISQNQEELEKDVKLAFEQFGYLGLPLIREDIFSQHCFWAQLPGNFRYLRRQKIINTHRIAGFASLNSLPSGLITGNHWGPAVTVLKTILNQPYFFNFHNGDLGHSLIIGPENSGKTTLLNFLLTQARRFDNRIFYFDLNNKAKCFIKAIAGNYYQVLNDENDSEFLRLNPLYLEKNQENKNFLIEFFNSLIAFAKEPIDQIEINLIPEVIEEIFSAEINNFAEAAEFFNKTETAGIYKILKVWNGEKLKNIFGSDLEIDWSKKVMAFDLTKILTQKPILIPVVNYLMFRVQQSLDGSPSIIIFNDAWNLLDNAVIAPKIDKFLQEMQQKNCVVIFASKSNELFESGNLSEKIKHSISAKIFMPDKNPHNIYTDIFGLNEEELNILTMMEEEECHFFFKHGDDSVISSLNLNNHPEMLEIFSAEESTILAMEEVINSHISADEKEILQPAVWLPEFFKILQALRNSA